MVLFCCLFSSINAQIATVKQKLLHSPVDYAPGWEQIAIGGADGEAFYDPGQEAFILRSSGISLASDVQQFAFVPVTGDFEFIAKVLSVEGPGWAGLMVRENSNPTAAKAAIKTAFAKMMIQEFRIKEGAAVITSPLDRAGQQWLKLNRNGRKFRAYTSVDGHFWQLAFSKNLDLGNALEVGLFVESTVENITTTVAFSGVSFNGARVLDAVPQQEVSLSLEPVIGEYLDLQVFPNPATSNITACLNIPEARNVYFTIYHLSGQAVKFWQTGPVEGPTEEIDLTNLRPGSYFLEVRVDGHRATQKFVRLP